MPKQLIEVYNEDTDEYEPQIQNVNPYFAFVQGTDEEMAAIHVCTKQYLDEFDEFDEDISPAQFSTEFITLDEVQGTYKLNDTELFLFHEVSYGTWCVAELKNGKYDINGTVDADLLVYHLEAHGFRENPGVVGQYF